LLEVKGLSFFILKQTIMSNKIATVTIAVPYKGSGGVIRQNEVSFDVYQQDGHYSLRPDLSVSERQLANLPEELQFVIEDGKPVSLRGKMDGNFHVIQDVVVLLQEQQNQLV
jgi:hypothetical protein